MQSSKTVSPDIIDRRKHMAVGVFAGVLATLLGVLGVRVVRTGSDADPDRDLVYLVSSALDRCQDFWEAQVAGYHRAKLVLYEHSTDTACGVGLDSAGPFYCPSDDRAYVDLSFIRAIKGDLARAYVIAHELGHKVQRERGWLDGRPSVQVELEADCLAGQWMHNEQLAGRLEVGDVQAADAEAASVGDDRICPSCSPESFTHGTAAQRVEALTRGLSGASCHP